MTTSDTNRSSAAAPRITLWSFAPAAIMLLLGLALGLGPVFAGGLLDDEDVAPKPAPAPKVEKKGALLDDEDIDAPPAKPAPKAPAKKGGLLDDEDVPAKPVAPPKPPAKKGGLLDDEDDASAKPVAPPKPPAKKGGLLDDEDDAPAKPVAPPKPPAKKGGLLDDEDDAPAKPPVKPDSKDNKKDDGQEDPHVLLYNADAYPSASKCATCHQKIYDEWRVSNHAYASISPMFHKFEQRISELSQGTVGFFCMRCHASVGTTLGEPRELPLWERSQVSREGVTCITCHRVDTEYNKVNGARRIEPGNIHAPVFGSGDGSTLAELLKATPTLDPVGDKKGPAMKIHSKAIHFEQISKSEFCVSCHQVAVHPGIKLEVVWDQYRASPAMKAGTTCQDCHTGKVPGVAAGYEIGPAAIVNGKPTPDRKHTNHSFYGPGYPIAHPGIFPHNPKAEKWKMETWLKFDHRAGWGSPDFEEKVDKGQVKVEFPKEWSDPFDREDARIIVEENIKLLHLKKSHRQQVMENGSRVDGPFFATKPSAGSGLKFHYVISNTDPGHNLPSGSLGAQPEIWVNVALTDPEGKNIWESGYVDKNGDMADLHSLEVAAGKIKHDSQLVNFQTKFLTTNVKGTDREMYLPINVDIDQLPFIRPSGFPITVMNHPPFIRMESRSIPPLSSRKASYSVPSKLMAKPGKYKLAVRLRSRAEPIYFMRFVGATKEMEQSMNEWMMDFHAYAVEFEVK